MECTNLEIYIFGSFALLILLGNFTSSKMQKNTTPEIESAPRWKLLLGDLVLPKNYLTKRGLFWRKMSLACGLLFLAWALVYTYLAKQEWVCIFVPTNM